MTERSQILDSILDATGLTPLVHLSRIGHDLPCELLGKCEFMNPGGSVKDRIGVRMLLDAEKEGRIKPGDTLIEPTSGNTGIGLAMAAAVRGYRVIITLPEKMSQEKQVVLEALGAEIIRTPTEAAWDSPESHIGVAKRLKEIIPNSHILDQYSNPSNPLAHEEGTGAEIVEQCGGKLDAIVMTAGTGGTITGVARAIKKAIPTCKGVGYDFIPDVLDRRLVDKWIKSNDRESFLVARQLIRQEGLLVGGSSGSAVWAAMQVSKELGPGKRVVVILPDSIRNYLTKFADDRWMRQQGFFKADWEVGTVADIMRAVGRRTVISLDLNDKVSRATDMFKEHGISQMPVLDHGRLAGILTESDLLHQLMTGRVDKETVVAEVMERKVSVVSLHASSGELPRIFERGEVAIVVDDQRAVLGILTKMDLIEMLAARKNKMP